MLIYVTDADKLGYLEAWTDSLAEIGYEKPERDMKLPVLPEVVDVNGQFVKNLISKRVAHMAALQLPGLPMNVLVKSSNDALRDLLVAAIRKEGLRPVTMVTETQWGPHGFYEAFVRYDEILVPKAKAKPRKKRSRKKVKKSVAITAETL